MGKGVWAEDCSPEEFPECDEYAGEWSPLGLCSGTSAEYTLVWELWRSGETDGKTEKQIGGRWGRTDGCLFTGRHRTLYCRAAHDGSQCASEDCTLVGSRSTAVADSVHHEKVCKMVPGTWERAVFLIFDPPYWLPRSKTSHRSPLLPMARRDRDVARAMAAYSIAPKFAYCDFCPYRAHLPQAS